MRVWTDVVGKNRDEDEEEREAKNCMDEDKINAHLINGYKHTHVPYIPVS